MKFDITIAITYVLVILAILITIDSTNNARIESTTAIVSTSLIMIYLITQGIISRRNEYSRIVTNNIQHWHYVKVKIDYNSLFMFTLLLFFHFESDGTIKHILLIQAILFLVLLIYNTINTKIFNQCLLAIEEDKVIDLQHKIEELYPSKFSIFERNNERLILRKRWHTVKIIKNEFRDSNDILDSIEAISDITIEER